MLLANIVFLHTVVTIAGYGYEYGSYGSKEEKSECKKLKHYDVTPPTDSQLNRNAKFTHLTKNGKDYVMISCPNDSFKYALISENSGSVFDISGSEYPNTVVLAAGFKIGFVAKCDEKRIVAETTDGNKIKLENVACIKYSKTGASVINPPVTSPPVTSAPGTNPDEVVPCDIKQIAPIMQTGTAYTTVPIEVPGDTKVSYFTCKRTDDQVCSKVTISATTSSGPYLLISSTGRTATEATYLVQCNPDNSFWTLLPTSDLVQLNQLTCDFIDCAVPCSELAGEGDCKKTKVTCTADTFCENMLIVGKSSTGSSSYNFGYTVGSVSKEFTCEDDGGYTDEFSSGITEFGCSCGGPIP